MPRPMPDVRLPSVDDALRELERLSATPIPDGRPARSRRTSPKRKRRRWLLRLVLGALAAMLPFPLLVRAAVLFYADYGLGAWTSVGLAATGVAGLLAAYGAFAAYKLRGRIRVLWMAKVAGALVAAYCAYALAYVSAANVKAPEVAATYTALHPLLRLATSTLILADGDLVVTDAARAPSDYRRMGLPAAAALPPLPPGRWLGPRRRPPDVRAGRLAERARRGVLSGDGVPHPPPRRHRRPPPRRAPLALSFRLEG